MPEDYAHHSLQALLKVFSTVDACMGTTFSVYKLAGYKSYGNIPTCMLTYGMSASLVGPCALYLASLLRASFPKNCVISTHPPTRRPFFTINADDIRLHAGFLQSAHAVLEALL
jgi:hypothetical protein